MSNLWDNGSNMSFVGGNLVDMDTIHGLLYTDFILRNRYNPGSLHHLPVTPISDYTYTDGVLPPTPHHFQPSMSTVGYNVPSHQSQPVGPAVGPYQPAASKPWPAPEYLSLNSFQPPRAYRPEQVAVQDPQPVRTVRPSRRHFRRAAPRQNIRGHRISRRRRSVSPSPEASSSTSAPSTRPNLRFAEVVRRHRAKIAARLRKPQKASSGASRPSSSGTIDRHPPPAHRPRQSETPGFELVLPAAQTTALEIEPRLVESEPTESEPAEPEPTGPEPTGLRYVDLSELGLDGLGLAWLASSKPEHPLSRPITAAKEGSNLHNLFLV